MQLSGRSYIFLAATLFILAASLRVYSDYAQTTEGQAQIFAAKQKLCDWVSLDASNLRFGCHSNLISTPSGAASMVSTGGGSTLRIGQ